MKFSKEMEQALRSLGYIESREGLVNAREIADNQNIPFEKLSKTLQKLAASQIIEAHRGRQGGYSLARPLQTLSLMDLHGILDESSKVVPCFGNKECLSKESCTILPGMEKFQNELDGLLTSYSVADFTVNAMSQY